MIFMKTKNFKANYRHKFFLNLLQLLYFKSWNKEVSLQKLSIYYTHKNIRQDYKNNKLKIIAPSWNDEFELPDGYYSLSDIQN